jgi:AAA ATPase domain
VPLLEREAQLASLEKYAGEARRGDDRLVLIAGEAGVGTSALVEQMQRDLPGDTWCRGTDSRDEVCLRTLPWPWARVK